MSFSHAGRRSVLFLFMLVMAGGALSACNTMEGLGEDTESLGAEVEEEAEEAQ